MCSRIFAIFKWNIRNLCHKRNEVAYNINVGVRSNWQQNLRNQKFKWQTKWNWIKYKSRSWSRRGERFEKRVKCASFCFWKQIPCCLVSSCRRHRHRRPFASDCMLYGLLCDILCAVVYQWTCLQNRTIDGNQKLSDRSRWQISLI